MAYSSGQILTASELNAAAPEEVTTWSSPISSGITLGNGTATARYQRNGGIVVAYFRFVQGSSGGVDGDVTLTLPVTAAFVEGVHGAGTALDASGSSRNVVTVAAAGTTTCVVRAVNAASTIGVQAALSTTSPFTWASGDTLAVVLQYVAA